MLEVPAPISPLINAAVLFKVPSDNIAGIPESVTLALLAVISAV